MKCKDDNYIDHGSCEQTPSKELQKYNNKSMINGCFTLCLNKINNINNL